MAGNKGGKVGLRADFASFAGILLAVGAIVGGLLLDGGELHELLQVNAALIVFGGTIGAVMLTTSPGVLMRATRRIGEVFFSRAHTPNAMIEEIIGYATQARKHGVLSLEEQSDKVQDPFLKKALTLAVDGIDMAQIRDIMEKEIGLLEQRGDAEAKVYESAGGYSPTIGIIGAVLGLMQVMKNLANIEEVGKGIAAAFVATVYGVAAANLFFLPAGNKLRARVQADIHIREVALEGVLAIVEGLNPKLIRTKLEAYQTGSKNARKSKRGDESAGVPAPAEG